MLPSLSAPIEFGETTFWSYVVRHNLLQKESGPLRKINYLILLMGVLIIYKNYLALSCPEKNPHKTKQNNTAIVWPTTRFEL